MSAHFSFDQLLDLSTRGYFVKFFKHFCINKNICSMNMSSCSIKWCGKSSKTSSYKKDGITFHRPDYKSEIPHLLYGMHLENYTTAIMKTGMDLRTFLLLEEKDMTDLGMDLPYERQRLKSGLRSFHKRNWQIKAVGMTAQTPDNFSMLGYLTALGSHLHQIYVLEATLQYTLREYKKIQEQIKFEPPDSLIRVHFNNAAKKMLANIDSIRISSERVKVILNKVASSNPRPADLFREKTLQDVVAGYITEAVLVVSLGLLAYQAKQFFSYLVKK